MTGNAYKPVVDALAALVLRRDATLALQDLRELGATPLPTAPMRARLLARAVALLERLAGSEVDAGSAIRPAGPGADAQDVRGPERP